MQIGVIYPQTELPTDPDTVRAYVRQVEELGYRHFAIYDHVLGADPAQDVAAFSNVRYVIRSGKLIFSASKIPIYGPTKVVR